MSRAIAVTDDEIRSLLDELDDVWRPVREIAPRGLAANRLPSVLSAARRRGFIMRRRASAGDAASVSGLTMFAILDAGDEFIGRT